LRHPEVRESGTTFARPRFTNAGAYEIPSLRSGVYEMSASPPDFDMAPRTAFFLGAAKEPAAIQRSMPNFRHKTFITPASSSLPLHVGGISRRSKLDRFNG